MWYVIGAAVAYAVWLVVLWQWSYRRRMPFGEGVWGQIDKNLAQANAYLTVAASNIVLAIGFTAAALVILAMR
jgi:hypothetical protein